MQRLMVQGVYRHVRNPMISGVFFVLFGEAVLAASLPVFCWFVIFVIGNAVYIPLTKEPRLVKRFGDEYLTYKQNVPRWIPTFRPWWDLASAGWAARFGDLRPIRRREVG